MAKAVEEGGLWRNYSWLIVCLWVAAADEQALERGFALWTDERQKISDCMGGMEELCEMYESFLTAYDGMIVEAARRKTVRKRMEKVVQEAQKQLDQLYQDDMAEREHFRSEQGEYLPSDIWHGLDVMPAQFGFQRLNEEGLSSIPDLPKEAVAGALRRLKATHGV